jgi:hypothetical protein
VNRLDCASNATKKKKKKEKKTKKDLGWFKYLCGDHDELHL